MSDLQALANLGEIDRLTVETRKQLERYPTLIQKLDDEEQGLQFKIEDLQARKKAAQQEQRRIETEVKSLRNQLARLRSQQSMVKTAKEYDAINHETETLDDRLETLELEGLEQLDLEENAQAESERLAGELAQLKQDNETERQRLMTLQREKTERLGNLDSERRQWASQLDDTLLEDYEILDQRHPGSAVVPIEDGSCGGCNQSLVAHIVQEAADGQLVRCPACRRFVYDKSKVQ